MKELLDLTTAAAHCGTTRKALARRIERGTLAAINDPRTGKRLVTHEALEDAGFSPSDDPGGAGAAPGNHATPAPAADLSALLDRLERQAADLGRLRALTERAESLETQEREKRIQLESELLAARQRITELETSRRWFRRRGT